jgi:YfiH family protein
MPKVDTHCATVAGPQLSGWVPDWPVPAHVHAFMTTRAGGVSAPPFDSLNLGSHVHDDPAAVAHNRQLLANHLGARPVFLNQVHGNVCVGLHADTPDGTVADACFTQDPGVACTVMVADCLPVLLTDTAGRSVAAVHAGWRGLAGAAGDGGVLAQAIKPFQALALDLNDSGAMHSVDL